MNYLKSISATLALTAVMATVASAQVVSSYTGQREGSLTVSFQNYYNRINGKTAFNAQGGGVQLRHFFPKRGLLNVQIEPLRSNGSFGFGDNFISLTGIPFKGKHWDLYGGEFRTETLLVENPFINYQQPQIGVRGARVIARTGKWTASAFAGQESLAQGSRVTFRKSVPQSAFGSQLSGSVRKSIQLGFRFLQLNTSDDNSERTRSLFPTGRRVLSSTSGTAQTSVKVTKNLKLYGEASLNRAKMSAGATTRPSGVSFVAGPAYISERYTLRANYIRQGYGYLPAAGYYLGDRRGPSVDGAAHFGRVGVAGNWLQSSNNIERDTNVPDYFSRQGGGNVYVRLPLEFYISGSISKLGLRTFSADEGTQNHGYQQMQASLSRRLWRHNLRLAMIRTKMNMRGQNQQVNSWEVEDSFSWMGINASAAVRMQDIAGDENKSSYYTRSSLSYGRGRLNIYGNWEFGKDLANDTIFATNSATSTVVGMTWEAPRGIGIRLEGFRTSNNSTLNTQNLFLLSTRGIVPETLLNHSNDWNLYMRVSREIGWGSHVYDGQSGALALQAPLVGAIAGFVKVRTLAGDLPAPNVWVNTDTGMRVRTDKTGYFAIPEILQGPRTVELDADRLPADYLPTELTKVMVDVKADQSSRVELTVVPLVLFEGVVRDQDGVAAPGGVLVGLKNTDQQTTTDDRGRFGFYSLTEGDYEVEVQAEELPDGVRFTPPPAAKVSLRHGQPAPFIELRIMVEVEAPKPLKEVNLGGSEKPVKVVQLPAAKPAKSKPTRPAGKVKPSADGGLVIVMPADSAAAPARGRKVVSTTTPSSKPGRATGTPAKKKSKPELIAHNSARVQTAGRRLLAKSNN